MWYQIIEAKSQQAHMLQLGVSYSLTGYAITHVQHIIYLKTFHFDVFAPEITFFFTY